MAQSLPLPADTMVGSALPALSDPRSRLVRNVMLAFAGSLLLVLAAKVKVPLWPVPVTLQTLAILALGAAYGPRLGLATVALYLGYGLAGLPVFTNTPPMLAGPLYFAGPTGGFLIAALPAVAVAGWAAARGASLLRLIAGLVAADLVILGLGCLWLAFGAQMASGATGIGLSSAWAAGVQPFLIGEALKVALAASLVGAGWTLLKRRG